MYREPKSKRDKQNEKLGNKRKLEKVILGTRNFVTRKFGTREYAPSVFSVKDVFSALLFSLSETIPELM